MKYSRIHVYEYTGRMFASNLPYRDRELKYISKFLKKTWLWWQAIAPHPISLPCALDLPSASHRDVTTPSPCWAPQFITQERIVFSNPTPLSPAAPSLHVVVSDSKLHRHGVFGGVRGYLGCFGGIWGCFVGVLRFFGFFWGVWVFFGFFWGVWGYLWAAVDAKHQVCVSVSVYLCACACVCVCVCARVFGCEFAYIFVCIYIYAYIYTHTNAHAYARMWM